MPRSSLWSIRAYTRIWTARSVSEAGTAITELALPLLAAEHLGASNTQVGLLFAVGPLPLLVFGLLIGALTDRRRRLPFMVVADVARLLLVLAIPLAWWQGSLTYGMLLGIVVLVSVFNVLFDVASQALVNSLLPRHLIVIGNARMQTSAAIAETLGPGIAGILIRVASIPVAFVIDALTFAVSATALIGTRVDEAHVVAAREGRTIGSIIPDIRVGLTFLFRSDVLRTLTLGIAVWNLFSNMSRAMFVLFLLRTLGLNSLTIGIITAVGGAGFIVGSLMPDAVTRRFGLGHGLIAMALLTLPCSLTLAAASGPTWLAITLATVGFTLEGITAVPADINQFSLRNAVTPDHLRGRVASAARVLLRGTVPIGSALGGVLADLIGLRAVMVIGGLGAPLFALMIWRSSVANLRTLPDSIEPEPGTASPVADPMAPPAF